MKPIGATSTNTTPAGPGDARLARMRRVASQFEGVFVEQMFKVMRETVPQDGELSGGAGEEMFTSLLDEHVASEAPARWHRGVSDAIVSRLAPPVVPAPGAHALPVKLPSPAQKAP